MTLRRASQGWEFVCESALEDFVWANLEELLRLIPLKQQYFVSGQICDILSVDENKRLVVLELKNDEDRYVVQQLVRYYDALLEEKPFKEKVNYRNPVRLIAVAPTFHKHNFIDRKYTNLDLEFLQFEVLKDGQTFYLELKTSNGEQVSKLEIPYREPNLASIGENIPIPPPRLLEWLGSSTSEQQEAILKIRGQILGFDQRLQEITDFKSIKYGRGKTKFSTDFCFKRKSKEIVLFLWLPIPLRKRRAIGRMQISTTDWSDYLEFAHVPNGIDKSVNSYYLKVENELVRGYLDELVEEALEMWLAKI